MATVNSTAKLPAVAQSGSVQALEDKHKELRGDRQRLTKDFRSAERRKKRLRTRARQLADEVLVQALVWRMNQRNMKTNHRGPPRGWEARPRRPRHFPLAARPRPPKSAAAQVAEPPAGDPAQLLPRLSPSPAMPRGCVCPHPRVQCSTGSFWFQRCNLKANIFICRQHARSMVCRACPDLL